MTGAFHYRPKFVDIRVKKPTPEEAARREGERACDHVGCARVGRHPAPKSRERPQERWWFCQEHASDYNRQWNYFAGMSDADYEEFARQAEVGFRPTWTFKPSPGDRVSASRKAFQEGGRHDPFGLFGSRPSGRAQAAAPPKRRLSRLEALALGALNLEEDADGPAIRARYAELVKRYHPDSNGGDRSTEPLLDKAVKAYQVLKAGGYV